MKRLGIVSVICFASCVVAYSKAPDYKTDVVTFTYTKSDVKPWPWTVGSITVTCTDFRGGSTAVVNGKTYGITGSEATHDTIRGYAKLENIMLDPQHDANPSRTAFNTRVEADCTTGMKGH